MKAEMRVQLTEELIKKWERTNVKAYYITLLAATFALSTF